MEVQQVLGVNQKTTNYVGSPVRTRFELFWRVRHYRQEPFSKKFSNLR